MEEFDASVFIPVVLEQKVLGEYERLFSELVRFENEKPLVDWMKFVELQDYPDGAEDSYVKSIEHLIELGILSFCEAGNYRSFDEGENVNPDYNGKKLFFTREEDAIGYSISFKRFSTS